MKMIDFADTNSTEEVEIDSGLIVAQNGTTFPFIITEERFRRQREQTFYPIGDKDFSVEIFQQNNMSFPTTKVWLQLKASARGMLFSFRNSGASRLVRNKTKKKRIVN